jgi:hypothetical protein
VRWSARPGDDIQTLFDADARVASGQIAPVGVDPQILPHFAAPWRSRSSWRATDRSAEQTACGRNLAYDTLVR